MMEDEEDSRKTEVEMNWNICKYLPEAASCQDIFRVRIKLWTLNFELCLWIRRGRDGMKLSCQNIARICLPPPFSPPLLSPPSLPLLPSPPLPPLSLIVNLTYMYQHQERNSLDPFSSFIFTNCQQARLNLWVGLEMTLMRKLFTPRKLHCLLLTNEMVHMWHTYLSSGTGCGAHSRTVLSRCVGERGALARSYPCREKKDDQQSDSGELTSSWFYAWKHIMFPTVRDVIDVVNDVIDDVIDDVIGMSLMMSLMMSSISMSSYALVLLKRTIDKVIFFFTTGISVYHNYIF